LLRYVAQASAPLRWSGASPALVAARRMMPATTLALPFETPRAILRTQIPAAGSPSLWKHHAAFQMYSMTWMKSTTRLRVRPRFLAWAFMTLIWWPLPSTRPTQVR